MIRYDKLWRLLRERGISQYQLIHEYGIPAGRVDALKHNRNVRTPVIDRLCAILDCEVSDIVEQERDDELRRSFQHT